MVPLVTPLTRPVVLTVATLVFEEDQAAVFVRFCELPSLNLPVAMNCCGVPITTVAFEGVMLIDVSVGTTPTPLRPTVCVPEPALS